MTMRRRSTIAGFTSLLLALLCRCDAFRCGHLPAMLGEQEGGILSAAVQAKKSKMVPSSARSRDLAGPRRNIGNAKNNRKFFLPNLTNTLDPFKSRKLSSGTVSSTTTLRGGAVVLATATTSPPLSVWLSPALACALAYALYNLFIKRASDSIDPILGGVLLQIVAATLGALLLAAKQVIAAGSGSSSSALQWSRVGVSWAIAAGAAVGMAEILSFVISSLGVPASKSIPTIIGGSVLMGTLLGVAWLGERLTWKGWTGIVMIAVGIAFVGMDPGSSASMH